jgi:CheY-like chemotaxis protein
MIYQDARLARQLAPHLNRVLVLDPAPASGRLVTELLRDLGAVNVDVEPTNALANAALGRFNPQVIFTELSGPGLDGLVFTRALRRGELPCRKTPVIVITAEATAAAILASRQAGVHEFLRKPYTIKDLVRRLDAAVLRPRDWIEAVHYVGPDRRRFNSGDYEGPRKRLSDHPRVSDKERTTQALQILRAAISAIESEPTQALRSMRVQADDLHKIGQASSNAALMAAAAGLRRCLKEAAHSGELSREDVEAGSKGLWRFLTAEDGQPSLLEVG